MVSLLLFIPNHGAVVTVCSTVFKHALSVSVKLRPTNGQVAASCQAGAALLHKAAVGCVEVGNGLSGESGHSGVYLVPFVELSRFPLPLLRKLVISCTSERFTHESLWLCLSRRRAFFSFLPLPHFKV